MSEIVSTLPKFVITHELPDGTIRYAYHRDLLPHALSVERYGSRDPQNGWTWIGARDGAAVDAAWSGDWFVASKELDGYVVRKKGARQPDGWIKRDAPHYRGAPVPPGTEDTFADLPERPDPVDVEHHREHDAAHACWACRAFEAHYCAAWVQGPDVEEAGSLGGFSPLPGGLPPTIDPAQLRYPPGEVKSRAFASGSDVKGAEMRWQVNDPSALAVFGRAAAHLLPGGLSGLRSAVGKALVEHPEVGRFYDWHDSSGPNGKRGFDVMVRVPWETPRTKTVREKPTPRSRKTVAREVPVFAIEQTVVLSVPERVAAPTLAEALARWDDAVEEQVSRFFPYGERVVACNHCEGRGWRSGR